MSDKQSAGFDEDAAVAGIGYALLTIVDAIRGGSAGPDMGEPRADIAKDYHTEAIEGVAEAIADVGITLEAIRIEVADLRAVLQKYGNLR